MLAAVSVNVVAAEENICLVAINDLGEPSDWLARGRIAEVLLVDGRRVAPTKNVIAGLLAECDSLLESVADVRPLSGIARSVNRVVVDSASVPGSVDRGRCSNSDSCSCTVLAREQRIGYSHRGTQECEGSVCDHGEVES